MSACSVPVSRVIPAYAALRLKRFVDSLLPSPRVLLVLQFFRYELELDFGVVSASMTAAVLAALAAT